MSILSEILVVYSLPKWPKEPKEPRNSAKTPDSEVPQESPFSTVSAMITVMPSMRLVVACSVAQPGGLLSRRAP